MVEGREGGRGRPELVLLELVGHPRPFWLLTGRGPPRRSLLALLESLAALDSVPALKANIVVR